MIQDVLISDLKVIEVEPPKQHHSSKLDDTGFKKFGECYFSYIDYRFIKGWKRHSLVTLNLTVPLGIIKFVMFDSRENSKTYKKFQEVSIGESNYKRLTIPPLLWVAFQGLEYKQSILMNLIDLKHDPSESENRNIDYFKYDWSS